MSEWQNEVGCRHVRVTHVICVLCPYASSPTPVPIPEVNRGSTDVTNYQGYCPNQHYLSIEERGT